MTTAIIIARGGSRRLPRKNVLPFCGHPLIAWTIVQCKTADLIDRVIMCTEDDEIEAISKDYGAEVVREPKYPAENAHRAFRWAIDKGDVAIGADDEILSILPTSPIRRPGDFDFCITERRRLNSPTIGSCCVNRETSLKKITGPNRFRTETLDKNSNYALEAAGINVSRARFYCNYLNIWPDDMSIKEFDEAYGDNPKAMTGTAKYRTAGEERASDELPLPGESWWWFEVPWWMQFEVDTAEEFEFCEVVMEHYILKGKTMEEIYG